MNYLAIVLTAFALAMDAFAVAACLGLDMKKATIKSMLIVGGYFGVFQGLMPLIGFYIARLFADQIIMFDHWIAFALLCILGAKMVWGSFKKEQLLCVDRVCPAEICVDRECPKTKRQLKLTPLIMVPFAFATSVDALAAGITFAFLDVKILPAVAIIGAITFVLSAVGVKIGNIFGTKLKSKAELFGGILLIAMGIKILVEHLIAGT